MARPLQVFGAGEIYKMLKYYSKKYPMATGHAIYAEGLEIERESTRRAPVEFARLRASAYTVPPTEQNLTAETGFGTEYAAVQHEELTFQHPRGGEAKYLEKTVYERMPYMLETIRQKIKTLVKKGVTGYPQALSNARPMVAPAPKKTLMDKAKKRIKKIASIFKKKKTKKRRK